VANVLLDGVHHDHQLVGDLLVGLSRAQQSQHLQLAVPTMYGHLLLWRAPAPIRSLSPLPCRSSSTDRCGASRDLRARIMEKRSNFPGAHTRLVIFL
jgi:hypothetical protein